MKQVLTSKGITWINMEAPEVKELAEFVRELKLSSLDAEFIVQEHHRPEIAARPHYLLILIQVPVFDRTARVTTGVPLYFLITHSGVWTVQYQPILTLQKIIKDFEVAPEKQEDYFGESSLSLALHVINTLFMSAFEKLERLNKNIEIAADAVFQGNERKMVEEIVALSRDVMDFRKVIRPQRDLFSEVPVHDLIHEEARTQWRRLAGQTHRMWEVLTSLSESVKYLGGANRALLQHKENQLLRLLTVYSIVIIPLWVLVTPYNPRGSDANLSDVIVFWSVVGILFLALLFIFVRLRKKRVL